MEDEFKSYNRIPKLLHMRPYVPGEDLTNVKVRADDDPETDLGMIARDPQNHDDQWYVPRAFADSDFKPVVSDPRP